MPVAANDLAVMGTFYSPATGSNQKFVTLQSPPTRPRMRSLHVTISGVQRLVLSHCDAARNSRESAQNRSLWALGGALKRGGSTHLLASASQTEPLDRLRTDIRLGPTVHSATERPKGPFCEDDTMSSTARNSQCAGLRYMATLSLGDRLHVLWPPSLSASRLHRHATRIRQTWCRGASSI